MATEFNHEFIERRLSEHRRFQHDLEAEWTHEIIDEVQALPKRKPRTGDLFTILPDSFEKPKSSAVRA